MNNEKMNVKDQMFSLDVWDSSAMAPSAVSE